MGCMQSFVWGETYPDFADALMPLACLPVQLAGRNRMMRYMAIENIERDPTWKDGNYTTEPVEGLRTANEMLLIMGSAPLVMQTNFPTRKQAEAYVDNYLSPARSLPSRRQQPHLLRKRQPQLRPQHKPRPHQGPRHVHQLRR